MLIYFISIITIILYLWLSYLALKRWKRSKAIRRFTILLFLSALWMVTITFETIVESNIGAYESLTFLAKVDFSLAALISFFLAAFAWHFPNNNKRITKTKETLLFLPVLALSILSFFGIFFRQGLYSPDQYRGAYWVYIAVLLAYFVVLGLGGFLWKLKHSLGVIQLQLKYFSISFGASIFFLLGMSIWNAIVNVPPYFDLWISNATLIFVSTSAYAVLKHRLFGLHYLVHKGIVLGASMMVLFFIYTYALLSLSRIYGREFLSDSTNSIVTVFLIVVSYPFLYRFLRRLVNKLFDPSEAVKRERILSRVSQFTEKMNFLSLFGSLENELKRRLGVVVLQGIVLNVDGSYDIVYPKPAGKSALSRNHALVRLLKTGERLLVRQEIPFLTEEQPEDRKQEYLDAEETMEKTGAEVVLMIGSSEVAPALALLPKKKNDNVYTSEEISFLNEIAYEASPTFENLFLYNQALKRAGVEV